MYTLYDCLPAGITANLDRAARAFAKRRRVGAYQWELVKNRRAWNQSDLKGRASEWRSKYKKAAASLLADLRLVLWNSQYYPYVERGDGGRLVITTRRSAWFKNYGQTDGGSGQRAKMAVELAANDKLRPWVKAAMAGAKSMMKFARTPEFGAKGRQGILLAWLLKYSAG